MRQTAVDWLIEKLHRHSGHIDILDVASLNNYWKQAKQMEKEQIQDAYWDGIFYGEFLDGQEYYKETYEQK